MPDYGVINDKSPHIIADLCELISYLEARPVSRGDIESFINTNGGVGLLTDLNVENDSAESNARMQALTEDVFNHLGYRQASFGDWYPFVVNHDVIELKAKCEDRHRIYATFLADSRLKMFPPTIRLKLAAEFEDLCREASPGLLPNWTIYHFGVGGRDRHLFGNKLSSALEVLATKIRDTTHADQIAELSPHNVGDGGIDIVALYDWNDPARGLPVFFGQCAAQQTGWPEKRYEAHPITHDRYFHFFHKPGVILFIPLCYRGSDGKWIDSSGFNTIIIDRLRLINLFEVQISERGRALADIMQYIKTPLEPGIFISPAAEEAVLAAAELAAAQSAEEEFIAELEVAAHEPD